ncbi:hypothetical protein [Caudoviricetes sp.]|nr:hypothetical protein [Caudoviricetes sp.]UOF81888.1 hypothetical protein [Caudoviricetes sp.]
MKRIFAIYSGAVVLVAATAFAVTQQLDINPSLRPSVITGGLIISRLQEIQTDTLINTHRITRSLGGSATIDFAAQTITCNTSTITVTGAQVTDLCMVSPDSTGGAANSSFTCYVSAVSTVTVKHCPAGTASDPASQTYYVRVFSNL